MCLRKQLLNFYSNDDSNCRHIDLLIITGAYYYYLTAPNMNYEGTIMAIAEYGKRVNIPYRFVRNNMFVFIGLMFKGITIH